MPQRTPPTPSRSPSARSRASVPPAGGRSRRALLEEDHRPRLVCAEGHVTWRNPRVVVGTLPIEGGRVYLARRAIEPALGRWGNPSGFLELGESAQEGARRETEEETELRVEVGRLVGVYSRPHAGIVTIAFEAAVVGGRPEPAAETSEVRAFGPDEIPWDELAFSTRRERAARLGRVAARARVRGSSRSSTSKGDPDGPGSGTRPRGPGRRPPRSSP